MNRRHLLAAAATAALSLGTAAAAQDPVDVGFIYVGPIGDFGWSYEHNQGRLAIEEEFGDRVRTTYVESVPEGADAERVLRQMAQAGADLIFTTSFGFMNATQKVALRFPEVKFEHATGYKREANLATYSGRFYEGRVACGLIAGKMSKSGIIGYVGSFPIPEVVSGMNAFTIALRSVNPAAEVRPVWVNTWYDPGKEASAAKALIDQGADILAQHTDSPAIVQEAESRGVHAFGQSSDMARFGQNAHLTAIVDNWGPYYIERVKAVQAGTWQTHNIWWGLKEGMVEIAPYGPAVPPEVAQEADQVKNAIIAGELHPFAGPIYNQAGELVVAEGQHLSDEQILHMDYYVQGIQGSLPT